MQPLNFAGGRGGAPKKCIFDLAERTVVPVCRLRIVGSSPRSDGLAYKDVIYAEGERVELRQKTMADSPQDGPQAIEIIGGDVWKCALLMINHHLQDTPQKT